MILTAENYFSLESEREHLSNSQISNFLRCEAKAMALIEGQWVESEKDCFLVGRYIHAFFEGTLDKFKAQNPGIFCKSGVNKGELKSQFRQAEEIIAVIEDDPLMMMALEGQKEVIRTFEMFGTKWKVMLDAYNPKERRFADLKVLRSLHERIFDEELGSYVGVFEYRRYFVQAAIYAEGERISSGRGEGDYFEPFIVAVSKEPYPDKAVISFQPDGDPISKFVTETLEGYVKPHMERVLAVKSGQKKARRCERCDFCRSTKRLMGTTPYTEYQSI